MAVDVDEYAADEDFVDDGGLGHGGGMTRVQTHANPHHVVRMEETMDLSRTADHLNLKLSPSVLL